MPDSAGYVRPSDVRIAELEDENERLRIEIRRLKREAAHARLRKNPQRRALAERVQQHADQAEHNDRTKS